MKSFISQSNSLDYKPMNEKHFNDNSSLPDINIKDFS